MIELVKYFRILFMSAKLSRERLKNFTEDHISRLTANNPGGVFNTILADITTAYNGYFGDLSSVSLNLAQQEGKTLAMEEKRTALLSGLSDNEKLVAYTYRNDAPVYEEFYPLGITEYLKADLPTLETLGQRYKDVLASHSADFPPAFVTDYNALLAAFVAARAAQQAAFGNVAAERSDITLSRLFLAENLTKNLLTIALHFLGDESKADVYFNQAILNAAFAESERRVEGEIAANTTVNLFDNITKATVSIIVKNTGSEPFVYGFVAGPAAAVSNDPERVLMPSQEKGTTAGEAGWSATNKFLNVTNYSANVGSYVGEKP